MSEQILLKNNKAIVFMLSVVALLLILVVSISGYLLDDGGSPYDYTTIRGEVVKLYGGNGIYKFDNLYKAVALRSFGIINLSVGFPMLIISLLLYLKNIFKGKLLLAAVLYYFCYSYLLAVMGNSYNILFMFYTLLYSSALFGIFFVIRSIGVSQTEIFFKSKNLHIITGILFLIIGTYLLYGYLSEFFSFMINGTIPDALDHYTTMELSSFEIAVSVPLYFTGGIMIFMKKAAGYVVSAVLTVTTSIMFLSLSVSEFIFFRSYDSHDLTSFSILVIFAVIFTAFTFILISQIRNKKLI